MTDDVCDSWEDVDVDKLVIKSSNKTQNNKPTYSSILAANATNSNNPGAGIDDKNSKILSDNFEDQNTTNESPFRILQRVSNNNSPFNNQPKIILEDNTRTQFVKGLRILNRPNKNNETKNEIKLKDDKIQEKLKKSFEEKQAEYAKARLRILGEVMPTEDLVLSNLTNAMHTVSLEKAIPEQISANKLTKPNLARTIGEDNDGQQRLIIIRQPIAPDGTKGFHGNK